MFGQNHKKDLSQELFLIKLKHLILVRLVPAVLRSNIRPKLVDIVNGKSLSSVDRTRDIRTDTLFSYDIDVEVETRHTIQITGVELVQSSVDIFEETNN